MALSEVETFLGHPNACGMLDIKGPDGNVVRKEIQSASWISLHISVKPGGEPDMDAKRITVQLQEGKVTTKEAAGLE
jgi:hypothetical protein